MLTFSARMGALAQRIGPRLPMTVGPIIVGVGTALLARVEAGTSYWTTVLPAVVVLGAGLVFTVAPLTAAVLGAIDDRHAGVGSAINNAGVADRGAAGGRGAPRRRGARRRRRTS